MAVFVARFGCPITTPNLLHFGLKFLFWKLSEDVRTRCCQRIWTTLHNQKPKYAIEQKKRPLRVKPIMDKKKCPCGFPGIYIYMTYFKQTDCIFLRLPRCRRFHHQKVLCTWPHKTLAGGFQDGFRTWHSNPSRNVWHSPCKKPHQVEVLTMNVTIDLRTFSNWLA
jgi:hypothetical protein